MKNVLKKLPICCKTFLISSILAANAGVYADDTEVFYSLNVAKPNLLFVLDVSGSMNTPVEGETTAVTNEINTTITNGADDSYQSRFNGNRTSGSQVIDISTDTIPRFRFANVGVPQGAEITAAYIQFTSAGTDTGNANFNIYIDNSSNAPQQTNVFDTPLIQAANAADRIWTTNERWEPGDRGDRQKTRDLTELVQFIVGKNDWDTGNAMGFYLQANDNNRKVGTAENPNLAAPELHISYTTNKTRLQVMQESLRVVLDGAPDNVQVGLMNYGQSDISEEFFGAYEEKHRHHAVSGVAFPITDINEKVNTIITSDNERFGLPSVNETVTVREYIADIADDWQATSFTPIVDALYEAALYYRGEKMHYGQRDPLLGGAHPKTHYGSPVTLDISDTNGPGRDNATAPQYRTPIESSCQDNYIVLMTDGAPTYLYNRNGEQSREPGPLASINGQSQGPQGTLASAITNCANAAGVSTQGNCGAELTHYLANNDNLPNPSNSFPYGQEGDQFIQTFAIGFGTGAGTETETYLKSLATYDDGNLSTNDDGYFLASNPEELAAAFANILAEVAAPKGALASPGYSVNVKNGLEHEKDIFIPVFDRKNSSRWSGNLKKFRIVDSNNKRVIVGKNNALATDELGNFTSAALDYWSDSSANDPDGRDVEKGGVANLLDPDSRNIFSNLTGTTNVTLNTAANRLNLSNINNLTNSVLGLPSSSTLDYRKRIVSFMRGWMNGVTDSSATPPPQKRYHMGDMLHSEPLVMTYSKGTGPSQTGKQQYIFAGTNEGYMHAFDAETGEEKFAFIPAELLKTLSEPQFLNAGTQVDHKYGIDGAITADFIGGDDGYLNAGDQVIIYFGLRRGGTSYYALDVTDIDNPKLLWKKSADDHPSMGQSWGTPYVARVADQNGAPKDVVIVTGGYDEDEDRDFQPTCANENGVCTLPVGVTATVFYGANNRWASKSSVTGSINCDNATFGDPIVGVVKSCKYESNQNDYDSTTQVIADVGNDLFIFDAQTGDKVWSMSSSMRAQIKNSIAGGIRPLDTNDNNLVDRIYFGDTGGNVWRLDLSENNGSTTRPTALTKLASLGGTGADNRMFFNEPDIALMRLNGRSVYAVSIGSGFRAHPLDREINDKFYVLLDESPFSPLETQGGTPYSTITEADLSTITVSSTGGITRSGDLIGSRGWSINLPEDGEKVLGEATAVNGSIIFPTLVPEVLTSGVGIDQCAAPVIFSRVYAIDILTGTAKWDLNGDGSPVPFTEPVTTEIISSVDKVFNTPDPATPIFGEDGQPTGETECNHTVDLRVGKKSSQVSGYNTCRLESVYWSDPSHVK